MTYTFEEAKKKGDILEDEILSILNSQERFTSKEWLFNKNSNLKDAISGDIIGYTSNGRQFMCIDAKNSNMISLNSIAAFTGFRNGNIQRAYFMSPNAIINNTEAFKNWVLNGIYQIFSNWKLRQLTFQDLAVWLKQSYEIDVFTVEKIDPVFGIMSRSGEIGINIDKIPLHFKMFYSNENSLNEESYWIQLYKDLKFKI
jgi:hypothetical protein